MYLDNWPRAIISRGRNVSGDTAGVCAICSVLTKDVIIVFPRHTYVQRIVIVMYQVGGSLISGISSQTSSQMI